MKRIAGDVLTADGRTVDGAVSHPGARQVDATVVRDWAAESVRTLQHRRGEIDGINVYPVADSDTGTNLLATVNGGYLALRDADTATEAQSPTGAAAALAVFAGGAVRAARGNSGVILAQALRGLAEAAAGRHELDGCALATAFRTATTRATAAVANPVAGTMLSVLGAAVDGARSAAGGSAGAVADLAAMAATRAVSATPQQLVALATAGVVDAGGRGLAAVLSALATVLNGRQAERRPDPATEAVVVPEHAAATATWEVMYLLDGLDEANVPELSDRLTGIGDSVSVAADGAGTHVVHVHCGDIGAVLEAGIAFGTPRRVSVEPLPTVESPAAVGLPPTEVPQSAPAECEQPARGVVAVVRGEPLASMLAAEEVGVLRVAEQEQPGMAELRARVVAAGSRHVTILAAEPDLTATVEQLTADRSRDTNDALGERETVVVPCRSPVQLLAALAVHDPDRRAGDDVVGMAEAAGSTRRGELRVAAEQSLTWLGTAEAGALVGLVDGEVVTIEGKYESAADVTAAVIRVLTRMLALGGELVTVLAGEQAPEGLADDLAEWVGAAHPEVEFDCYPGGQRAAVVLIGVE